MKNGFRPVVAVNRFDSDTSAEIDLLMKHCESQNVAVALNESWSEGGAGAIDLAEKVLERIANSPDCFRPLYELSWTFEKKISILIKTE
jgi:formate--tetrahydrofolate ligase